MKALFLIQGFEVPSSRYRVLQFLPAWEEAGHEKIVLEHSEALTDTKKTLELAKTCQVVFIHRKRISVSLVKKFKALGCRIVYDVDDAVMFKDATHRTAASASRRWRYKRLMRVVDTIIVGNRYIASHTEGESHVLPTCLSLKRYEAARELPEAEKPTLVWIGDTGSMHYLERLKPALEEVGKQVAGCRLKIICNTFFDLENMEVLKVDWNAETEVQELADSQVGLMPLAMDSWSRGKCALKFIQYLAVGRPAVVTPAGMNADILELGECGLKAVIDDQWVNAMVTLLNDKDLRHKLGEKGRQIVADHYSLESRQAEWVNLVSGQC